MSKELQGKEIWIIILVIAFAIMVINIFNNAAKSKQEAMANQNKEQNTTQNTVDTYKKESVSVLTGEEVPEKYQKPLGNAITQFCELCKNQELEGAYDMLSDDVKRIFYPSYGYFVSSYYKERFMENADYSFELWKSYGNDYTYKIKIFENLMASGKSNSTFSEDYITPVPDGAEFKLNINGYIGKDEINKKGSNDKITILSKFVDNFMDYQIIHFRIKNNTDETVILDSRQKNGTVYITNERGFVTQALLNENYEEDLILKPNETKEIEIKFNSTYKTQINTINFVEQGITIQN